MHGRVAVAKTVSFGVVLGCMLSVAVFAVPVLAQQKPSAVPPAPEKAVPATGTPAVVVMDVKYVAGKLSVKAELADLSQLLKKISELSGIPVEVGPGVAGKVTVSFTDLALEEGINRILETAGEKNLATEYTKKPGQKKDEYKIEKIVVVRKGAPSPVAPALDEKAAQRAMEIMAKRDQEYREFFEKMDKQGNKIARAVSAYRDPKASRSGKAKLRTYLRQTSVHDPADIMVLKAALRDPEIKGEIISDIQMALLHAFQEKRDGSDKEFILELLERRDNSVGWLYYSMLNMWDDRYVPYLMEGAREGMLTDIEILGRAKVKQAVPLLEELWRTSENAAVRREVWGALLQITGKEYKREENPPGANMGEKR